MFYNIEETYIKTPSARFDEVDGVLSSMLTCVTPEPIQGHLNCIDGVPFFTFPALEKETWLVHGFSTRLGGVSTGCLSSMNLSFAREEMEHPGDSEAEGHVRENYRRIARAIGFSPENLVFSAQTHTTNIRRVTKEDAGAGFTRPLPWTDVDGFVTNVPGPVLATFFADCVPLYFADPVHHAIGLSHSGWKGTVGEMGKCTVREMQEAFGSRPEDILAVIGPSISKEAFLEYLFLKSRMTRIDTSEREKISIPWRNPLRSRSRSIFLIFGPQIAASCSRPDCFRSI